MKYIAIFLTIVMLSAVLVFGQTTTSIQNEQFLRIHIRANSNGETDQSVKFKIKDNLIETLTPILAFCENKQDVYNCLNQNLKNIEFISNELLKSENCSYFCTAILKEEYFPTRIYENLTLESGIYTALILELGQGVGDNWWCLVYPPLCFVNGDSKINNFKSRILEIINSFFS